MDPDAAAYIDSIDPANRPIFDRVRGLIEATFPEAEIVWSYRMPTFVVGDRRLHVAAWRHGLSLYGWDGDRDGGFAVRHPDLVGDKGTLKLPRNRSDGVSDDDLRGLIRGSLGGPN